MVDELPEAVRSRIGTTRAGRELVRTFASLLNDLARKWRLDLGPPFANSSWSWVAPGRQTTSNGGERSVVLKVGVPGKELENQAEALAAFAGEGCVRLLDADLERGALLLERLQPGRCLARLDDDRAMGIALELVMTLWRPVPVVHPFRSVSSWCGCLLDFDPKCEVAAGSIPHAEIDKARRLLGELLEETESERLLHGDFHQFNVLDAGGGFWRAIDPKGAVGDIGFELGPLLRNLLLESDHPRRRLTRRAERAANHLGCAPEWVLRWAFVHSVLSALWRIDDGEPGLDDALACVEVMSDVLG